MKYCSSCGARVQLRIPPGDNRERFVCESCGTVHYLNPRIVVGCIPEWKDRILFCRRRIEPRSGKWTLPGGFLENNETVSAGAARETLEEACARVTRLTPYALFSLHSINQVFFMFRSRLEDREFAAGPESLEVKLFSQKEIPWSELAFPVIRETLKCYYSDQLNGKFIFHLRKIP